LGNGRRVAIARLLAVAFKREEKRGGRTGIYVFLFDSIRDKYDIVSKERKSNVKRVGLAGDRPVRRRSISGFRMGKEEFSEANPSLGRLGGSGGVTKMSRRT